MQKVEMYYSMEEAKRNMERHIGDGWRIHVCTMGTCTFGFGSIQDVLVVYER